MTQTIGIIGSGLIGTGIARLAVTAGFNVVLSNSRGPETLGELIAELGPHTRAATTIEAVKTGDLIVAAVPLLAYDKLPVAALKGKIVIDTMNYYPMREGQMPDIDAGTLTTSELVQQHLKSAKVVKALHNQDSVHLFKNARPPGDAHRTTLPIAGDDVEAKENVAEFMDAIGYDSIDIGALSESWRIEPGTPIYVWPYAPKVPEGLSEEEAKRYYLDTPSKPVSVIQAKNLVEKAVRKRPIGGFPEDLPPVWIAIISDLQKSK